MLSLLNYQLADDHRRDIQHEVEQERLASLYYNRAGMMVRLRHQAGFFSFLLYRARRWMSPQPEMQSKIEFEEIPMAEIKPALQATFSVLRDEGFVSDYDERFIEQFRKTFERELVHQAHAIAK
jgi:hypothetical protein